MHRPRYFPARVKRTATAAPPNRAASPTEWWGVAGGRGAGLACCAHSTDDKIEAQRGQAAQVSQQCQWGAGDLAVLPRAAAGSYPGQSQSHARHWPASPWLDSTRSLHPSCLCQGLPSWGTQLQPGQGPAHWALPRSRLWGSRYPQTGSVPPYRVRRGMTPPTPAPGWATGRDNTQAECPAGRRPRFGFSRGPGALTQRRPQGPGIFPPCLPNGRKQPP